MEGVTGVTQQVLRERVVVDITECRMCKFYSNTVFFELCTHEQSNYKVGNEASIHTCVHMRGPTGPCGKEARLLK